MSHPLLKLGKVFFLKKACFLQEGDSKRRIDSSTTAPEKTVLLFMMLSMPQNAGLCNREMRFQDGTHTSRRPPNGDGNGLFSLRKAYCKLAFNSLFLGLMSSRWMIPSKDMFRRWIHSTSTAWVAPGLKAGGRAIEDKPMIGTPIADIGGDELTVIKI